MKCDKCGYFNYSENEYCDMCGAKLNKTSIRNYKDNVINNKPTDSSNSKIYKILAGVIILFLIIIVAGYASTNHENQSPIENAIIEDVNETPTVQTQENQSVSSKINTTISVEADNVLAGQTSNITGYLLDLSNNPLTNQEVIVQIDNSKYMTRTGNDGKYICAYNNTTKGTHQIKVTYEGYENITGASNTTSIEVKEKTAHITINKEEPFLKGQKNNITGTLTDEDNNPIANAPLKVKIEENQLTINTSANGSYHVEYTPNDTQDKEITVSFDGNGTIGKATQSDIIHVIEDSQNNTTQSNNTIDETDNNTTNQTNNTKEDNSTNQTNNTKEDNSTNQTNNTKEDNLTNQTNNDTKEDNTTSEKTQTKIDVNITENEDKAFSTISGKLSDNQNKAIKDATIKIIIGDEEIITKTDDDGKYSVNYTNKTSESKDVLVLFEGDQTHNQTNNTIKWVIT